MIRSGSTIDSAHSLSTRGCSPSGPCDLAGLSVLSFFYSSSLFSVTFFKAGLTGCVTHVGISVKSSLLKTVKTLVKNMLRASDFSWSLIARPSFVSNSEIPLLTFVLLLTYL